jgi:hypothetical protein
MVSGSSFCRYAKRDTLDKSGITHNRSSLAADFALAERLNQALFAPQIRVSRHPG